MFENFKCLKDINPLLFSQLCIYCYADVVPAVVREVQIENGQIYIEAIMETRMVKQYLKRAKLKVVVTLSWGHSNDGRKTSAFGVPGNFTMIICENY